MPSTLRHLVPVLTQKSRPRAPRAGPCRSRDVGTQDNADHVKQSQGTHLPPNSANMIPGEALKTSNPQPTSQREVSVCGRGPLLTRLSEISPARATELS